MGRVIGIWRGADGGIKSGPPQRDDRFIPVIEVIRKNGWLDRPILTPACKTLDEAEAVKRSLYLACRYFCSCGERLCTRRHRNTPHDANPAGGCPDGGQRVSCRADVVRTEDGKLHVQFRLFDKAEAIRQVVATYGPDPANWPYNARAKRLKTNA